MTDNQVVTSPITAPTTTVTAPSGGTTALGATSVVVAAVLSGAFLAALVTAAITVWLARRKTREEERNRLRAAFAEAFASYQAYKEFPYAIRRRRVDAPGEERVRLSEALRSVQADLAYHVAWTVIESELVGAAFAELIKQVRSTAGSAMHEAWNAPANNTDSAMNIPPSLVDLGELTEHETVYIDAVRVHLRRLAPWWAR